MLDTDRLVAIDAGEGTVLLLFQKGAATPLEMPGGLIPAHESSGPGHFAFAIDAADCPRGSRGSPSSASPIESRVRWERGGLSLYFRDPDNRLVELATPGLWPSY